MTDVFIYTALKTQGVNNVLLDGHITTSFPKMDSLKRQGVVGMSFEIIGEYAGFVEKES